MILYVISDEGGDPVVRMIGHCRGDQPWLELTVVEETVSGYGAGPDSREERENDDYYNKTNQLCRGGEELFIS